MENKDGYLQLKKKLQEELLAALEREKEWTDEEIM